MDDAKRIIDYSDPGRVAQRFVSPQTFQLLQEAGMTGGEMTSEVYEALQLGFNESIYHLQAERERLSDPENLDPGRLSVIRHATYVCRAIVWL